MVVISKTIIVEFGIKHADSVNSLNKWHEDAKIADWNSLSDIKQMYNNVDYVGNDRYVFNLKGNKYRLVAMIFFDIRTIYIRFIGTHAEYNKVDCTVI